MLTDRHRITTRCALPDRSAVLVSAILVKEQLPVRKTVVCFVGSYRRADDVVLGLENAGIVGAEVELVSGTAQEGHNIGTSQYWFLAISMIILSMLAPRMLAQDLRSSLIRAPHSLSFDEATVGKASDPQTITLLNTGTASVQLNKIAITGDFSQTNNCPVAPAQLALNQTCNIEVTFKSSSAGPALGTGSVFHDGSAIPLNISLNGAGTVSVPIAKIYPFALNFPEQMTSPPSAPQTVTISNNGKRPLRLSSIEVDGDFTIMPSSTCESLSGSLAPDASCSAVVIFTPLGIGNRDGQITFRDDAEDSPQHVALSGIGKQ